MKTKIDTVVEWAIANHTPEELALGYLRYEILRRIKLSKIEGIHDPKMTGKRFDALWDKAITELESIV